MMENASPGLYDENSIRNTLKWKALFACPITGAQKRNGSAT